MQGGHEPNEVDLVGQATNTNGREMQSHAEACVLTVPFDSHVSSGVCRCSRVRDTVVLFRQGTWGAFFKGFPPKDCGKEPVLSSS